MVTQPNNFDEKLRQLKSEYIAMLPKKLAAIQDDWNSLKSRHSVETLSLLQRNVHSLMGTSGTFGFIALSQAARLLETSLKPLLEHSTQNFSFNAELAASINAQIHELFAKMTSIQNEEINTQTER